MATDPRKLADFEGTWTLFRTITAQNQPDAVFEGQAVWSPADAGLDYLETGTLCMPGQPGMQAVRRYHWSEDLKVWFDDGRFFHDVPPCGGAATHWCPPDMYRGSYCFADWPDFEVSWTVSGPRKSYKMISRYRRA